MRPLAVDTTEVLSAIELVDGVNRKQQQKNTFVACFVPRPKHHCFSRSAAAWASPRKSINQLYIAKLKMKITSKPRTFIGRISEIQKIPPAQMIIESIWARKSKRATNVAVVQRAHIQILVYANSYFKDLHRNEHIFATILIGIFECFFRWWRFVLDEKKERVRNEKRLKLCTT